MLTVISLLSIQEFENNGSCMLNEVLNQFLKDCYNWQIHR